MQDASAPTHLEEWHFREYCSAVGLVAASWRDLQELFHEVERMRPTGRAAWLADQELRNAREFHDPQVRKRIERAMRRGSATEFGKVLASGHPLAASAGLMFWLSRSIVSAE